MFNSIEPNVLVCAGSRSRRHWLALAFMSASLLVPVAVQGGDDQCRTAWKGALNVHNATNSNLAVRDDTQVWETGDRVLGVNGNSLQQAGQGECLVGDGSDPGSETDCRSSGRVQSFEQLNLLPSRPNQNFTANDNVIVEDGDTKIVSTNINPEKVEVKPGGTLVIEGAITINTENGFDIGTAGAPKRATLTVNGVDGEITRVFATDVFFDNADVDVTTGDLRTINGNKIRATDDANVNCGALITNGEQRSCSDTDGGVFGISKSKGEFEESRLRGAYYVDGNQFNIKGVVLQGAATGGGIKIQNSGGGNNAIFSDITQGALPNTNGFCEQPGPGNALLAYQMEQFSWNGTAGEVTDVSGNGRDGTGLGDVTTNGDNPAISGDPGTCRHGAFDGDDDYIEDNDAGAYINGLAGITLMGWVRNTAGVGNDNGIFATTSASGKDNNLGLRYDSSGFFTGNSNLIKASINTNQCGDNNDCLQVETQGGLQSDVGEWQHIAMVWKSGDKIRIYVDGREVQTTVTNNGIGVHDGKIDSVDFMRIGGSELSASDNWKGDIDEFLILDGPMTALEIQDLMMDTHPCPVPGAEHYAIDHSGTLVSCDAETVTVTAHDATHNPVDAKDATIALATDADEGTWARITLNGGNGTLFDVRPGRGEAKYTFPDNGETKVDLEFNYTSVNAGSPKTVNIDVIDGKGVTEDSGEDPDLTVRHSGFRITDGDGNPVDIQGQIAAKPNNAPPGAQSLALQAIRTSSDDPTQCEPAFPDATSVEVELGAECKDPVNCAGNQLEITNGGNTTAINTGNNDGSNSAPSYTPVELTFGPNAEAPLEMVYPDAGALQLHSRANPIDDGTGTPPLVEYISGSSNDFAVRPFGFFLDFDPDGDSVFDDRVNNATCAGQTSCAADADGDVFATAGVDFPVRIEAVVWQAADDGDDDGVPDSNQALADNAATPNFGQEAAAEVVDLDRSLVAPVGGSPGTLGGGQDIGDPNDQAFTNGSIEAGGVSWDEVGIIDLGASLDSGAYLGSDDVTGAAPNLGRFIPDRFTLSDNDPALRDGTGMWGSPFTYMGQAFTFASTAEPRITVTAVNTDGVTTANYGGEATSEDFWRLDTPAPTYADATSGIDATFSADTSSGSQTWDASGSDTRADYDGQGTLTISGDEFSYDRIDADTKQVPFDAMIDLTLAALDLSDADNVCFESAGTCSGFTLDGDDAAAGQQAIGSPAGTSTQQRYGRLLIDNAFGPEIAPVYVPMRVEYWDNGTWQINEEDVSTELALAELALANADGTSQPGNSDIVVDTDNFTEDANDTHEAGETMIDTTNTPVPVRVGADAGAVINDPGTVEVVMLPPGAENRGWVDIEALLPGAGQSYLQYDWDADGDPSLDDNPGARVTFGIFAGEHEHIYLREVFPAP